MKEIVWGQIRLIKNYVERFFDSYALEILLWNNIFSSKLNIVGWKQVLTGWLSFPVNFRSFEKVLCNIHKKRRYKSSKILFVFADILYSKYSHKFIYKSTSNFCWCRHLLSNILILSHSMKKFCYLTK